MSWSFFEHVSSATGRVAFLDLEGFSLAELALAVDEAAPRRFTSGDVAIPWDLAPRELGE